MTYHSTRKGCAQGCGDKSLRIAVSLPPDDMRRLSWLAAKRGVPVASVLRDAVWSYLLPIAIDADAEHRAHVKVPA